MKLKHSFIAALSTLFVFDCEVLVSVEIPDEVGSPVAVPDNAEVDHMVWFL